MIVIFARVNSNQKVAVECVANSVKPKIKKMLDEQYGGEWHDVEDIKFGSVLVYTDENVYFGKEPTREKEYTNIYKLY